MGKQLYFYEINADVGNVLSEFLNSENLAFLFVSLYSKVKKYIPDVVIRGIPGQIFGVSRLKERCLFYVTSSPDQSYSIHFKRDSGNIAFSKENAEKIAEIVFRETQHRKQNPRDYQIFGLQSPNEPKIPEPKPCLSNCRQAKDEISNEISVESVDNEISNDKSISILRTSVLPETEPSPDAEKTDHEKHTNISKVHTDSFSDKEIKCQDCGKPFIFSAGEQKYYYEKGFSEPKRCKPCRKKRKDFTEKRMYIGLGSITGKMGTKQSSYLDHAQTYGPSIDISHRLSKITRFS